MLTSCDSEVQIKIASPVEIRKAFHSAMHHLPQAHSQQKQTSIGASLGAKTYRCVTATLSVSHCSLSPQSNLGAAPLISPLPSPLPLSFVCSFFPSSFFLLISTFLFTSILLD